MWACSNLYIFCEFERFSYEVLDFVGGISLVLDLFLEVVGPFFVLSLADILGFSFFRSF